MNSARYIGTGETARILGVNRATIQRRAAAGAIPYVTKLDGRGGYLFDPAVIHTLATPSSARSPQDLPPAGEGVSPLGGVA